MGTGSTRLAHDLLHKISGTLPARVIYITPSAQSFCLIDRHSERDAWGIFGRCGCARDFPMTIETKIVQRRKLVTAEGLFTSAIAVLFLGVQAAWMVFLAWVGLAFLK